MSNESSPVTCDAVRIMRLWFEQQIENAQRDQISGFAERSERGTIRGEKAHSRHCAMFEALQMFLIEFGTSAPAQPSPDLAWRCFHCGEVFTDPKAAANHFGVDHVGDETLCQMAQVDGGIAKVIADLAEELQGYRSEDNTSYREFYALGADHRAALIKEEQRGYDRGLADAAAEKSPTTDAVRIALGNQLAMMCALHQLMRGFLAPDPLVQKRLSDCILATRVFGVSLADAPALPSTACATATNPADEIIGQIEERFPDWKGFRDLVDCIDVTLHRLRGGR